MNAIVLEEVLGNALMARAALFDDKHEAAFRLFNGFWEGLPTFAADLYGRTLLLHNYAKVPKDAEVLLDSAQDFYLAQLPWLEGIVVKTRRGETAEMKNGRLVWGETIADRITEFGVRYAVDLTMNQDASFYLDTRNLRRWALDNLAGKRVLNTFAYTSSYGVTAQAAGAKRVLHTDLSKKFLNVAKTSYTLNGFPINKRDFITGDFFSVMKQLKRDGRQFECIFIDPPFFSVTQKGRVDLAQNMTRLINKIRPLVTNGGHIVAINNALYLSGEEYMAALETLCVGDYVEIESLIPVAEDFTGYPQTQVKDTITDPAPFNHSTKIAVLKINHQTS